MWTLNVDLRTFSNNIIRTLIKFYKHSISITLGMFCPNIYIALKKNTNISESCENVPCLLSNSSYNKYFHTVKAYLYITTKPAFMIRNIRPTSGDI